ncbi:hypothetical protein SAMN05444514_10658 [Pseudomonas syringae]|nr:hypothetical protein SAMN05444514_10658 [Pseudomonas syringae]
MTAAIDRQRRVKLSLPACALLRITYFLRTIAYALRPEAPRQRLLDRCRTKRGRLAARENA